MQIGDKISRTLNGDVYTCGEVIRITDGGMIVTSTGHRFRKDPHSDRFYLVSSKNWSLLEGHIENPNAKF